MPINWSAIGQGAIEEGIGMLGGVGQASRQYHRQKKLMGIQYQNQRLLNQQGHDLQYDMWNKTSYPAQLEMMKNAGLSPGLMYGGGAGSGGSTGSQGGGSAASGSAVAEKMMDLDVMLKAKQLEQMDAQTDRIIAEKNKIEGVETEVLGATFKKLMAEAKTEKERARLVKIQGNIASIEEEYTVDNFDKNLDKMSAEIKKILADADLTERSTAQIVSNLTADYWLKASESNLNWAKVDLTKEQTDKVGAEIEKIINDQKIDWANVGIAEKNMMINNYRVEMTKYVEDMKIDFAKKKLIVDTSAKIFGDLIGLVSPKGGGITINN